MQTEMMSGIPTFMNELVRKYGEIRGKDKDSGKTPFWDLVIITAANEDQKKVYQAEIVQKIQRNELPTNLPIHVVADPPGPRLGNGGSTFTALSALKQVYADKMFDMKILLIHAGGQSQRMPSNSILGKIFSPIPLGDPMFQMLDLKLAMYWPFIPRMKPGVFVSSADDIIVYNLSTDCQSEALLSSQAKSKDNKNGSHTEVEDSEGDKHDWSDMLNWSFSERGFTALAHPSPLTIGTGHGVYVIDPAAKMDTAKLVLNEHCVKVLQKPNIEKMYKDGAVLKNLSFPDGVKVKGDVVYTDSAFYFGMDIAKKLLRFTEENGQVTCEIDAYGDFLQALGPLANADYIHNTSNVSNVSDCLIPTREKVFNLLNGSEINLLVMNSSQFTHIGTIREYISHFCWDTKFQNALGLRKDVFNCWTSDMGGGDIGPKKMRMSDTALGCVMHSVLQLASFIPESTIVEYCNFDIPVTVGDNTIVSNCQYILSEIGSDSRRQTDLQIPNNVFLHTLPVNDGENLTYVTIFFHSDDNIKTETAEVGKLKFMGKLLEDASSALNIDSNKVIADSSSDSSVKNNLWCAMLFPAVESMTESLHLALRMMHAIQTATEKGCDISSLPLLSMAQIMKRNDFTVMMEFRNKLYNMIVNCSQ